MFMHLQYQCRSTVQEFHGHDPIKKTVEEWAPGSHSCIHKRVGQIRIERRER